MTENTSRGSFWSRGLSGLIGLCVGAGGTYFSQQQANTVENQYFMELDQLRLSSIADETASFEDRLADLKALREVQSNGYRAVFEKNLERDIAATETALANIAKAREESEEAAARAIEEEQVKAAAAAEIEKSLAVRRNPVVFDNCGFGTNRICP